MLKQELDKQTERELKQMFKIQERVFIYDFKLNEVNEYRDVRPALAMLLCCEHKVFQKPLGDYKHNPSSDDFVFDPALKRFRLKKTKRLVLMKHDQDHLRYERRRIIIPVAVDVPYIDMDEKSLVKRINRCVVDVIGVLNKSPQLEVFNFSKGKIKQ